MIFMERRCVEGLVWTAAPSEERKEKNGMRRKNATAAVAFANQTEEKTASALEWVAK